MIMKNEEEGIILRIQELERELSVIMNEPAHLFTKYKGMKITRINRDILIYKKRLSTFTS